MRSLVVMASSSMVPPATAAPKLAGDGEPSGRGECIDQGPKRAATQVRFDKVLALDVVRGVTMATNLVTLEQRQFDGTWSPEIQDDIEVVLLICDEGARAGQVIVPEDVFKEQAGGGSWRGRRSRLLGPGQSAANLGVAGGPALKTAAAGISGVLWWCYPPRPGQRWRSNNGWYC